MLPAEHIAQGRLARPELTPAERDHLERCVQCRAERRVLLSTPSIEARDRSGRSSASSSSFVRSADGRSGGSLVGHSWAEAPELHGRLEPGGPRDRGGRPARLPEVVGGGRYRLLRWLGEGAFGVVYRAWDTVYGCEVALKSLPAPSGPQLDKLKAEFRRAAALSHPNLAMMYDLVVEGDEGFFTMELVAGSPPPTSPPMAPGALHSLAVQLLDGLAAIHGAGLVHRDIKPANILLEPTGRVVLVDFGLVTWVGEARHKLAGTMGYMAPEALDGAPPTPAVDLYGLGLVLLELARGESWPIAGVVPEPAELRAGLVGLPPALQEVVTRCLELDPRARPTAREAWSLLTRDRPVVRRAAAGPSDALVGRTAEIGWLEERARRKAVLRVEGAPGVGKSALVGAVFGARAITGRCHPWESVPFNALDAPLERLEVRPGRGSYPSEVARQVLERFPADGVLWIDDAQWMDEDSRSVLRGLVASEGAPPVVLSHRPIPAGHPLLGEGWFASAPSLAVGPLAPPEAAALAARLVDDAPDHLAQLSGGHPLLLRRLAVRWASGDRQATSLTALLQRELGDLGQAALAVLQRAAIHEGPLALSVLVRAAGSEGFPRLLAELIKARILAYTTTDAVGFVVDSSREVALAGLAPAERTELHAELAAAFAAAAPGDHGALAHHLAAAGAGPAVREPALRAARAAEEVYAWARAAEFYRLALEAGDDRPSELVRRRAEALAAAGHAAEAGRLLRDQGGPEDRARAAELLVSCGAFGEAEAVLSSALAVHGLELPRSWAQAVTRGGYWAVRALVRRPALAATSDRAAAGAADTLWTATAALGQFDSVRTFAFEGHHLDLAMRSGDPARAARALALHLCYLESSGSPGARGAALDRQLDDLVAAAGSEEVAAWVEVSRGYRQFLVGRMPAAVERFEAAEQRYQRTDAYRWERTLGWTHRVFAHGHLGRYDQMTRGHAELRGRFAELGDRASEAMLELGGGYLAALAADRPEEAEERLDQATALLPSPLPTAFGFLELLARVQVDLYRGRADAAHRRLTEQWSALGPLRWFRMPWMVSWSMWGATGAAAGAVGADALARVARRLRADPAPYAQIHGAALDARAAAVAGRPADERRALAAIPADGLGFYDVAAAARLRLATLERDHRAAEAVLEEARGRGIARPEAFLVLFG